MRERLCGKHVVLLGIGHTNAHAVRMWGMHPLPDTDLTCISDSSIATYSGMLPATLAGQIPREQMEIDLVKLCSAVGARLIIDRVAGLNCAKKQIDFEQRPPIPYDVLSIGIGSVPTTEGTTITGNSVVTIKPMQTFLDRLRARVSRISIVEGRPVRVVVVGSGVAGIEVAFCLPPFLLENGIDSSELHIVTRSSTILPELGASARRLVASELSSRFVSISTERAVKSVCDGQVELNDGSTLAAEIVIWATGASPPALLGTLGLPLDDRGFLATDATLRSTSGEPIFAVGDSGTIACQRLPKAGVYAVRQGPILWDNIGRLLQGKSLTAYEPQRSFLKLINTGDGKAIGQWHGVAFSGRWVMRWKDHIDTKFMNMFQTRTMNGDERPMQCRGCGSKLGADVLLQALAASMGSHAASGSVDLAIEDAVEIGVDATNRLVASTDFFSSPFDDAYLSGRIAALHAASDVVVTGARPTKALANVVLLDGDRKSQQQSLADFLAGARFEFDAMGASLVGGHTIVGPRMEVGFTVIGQSASDRLLRKSNLRAADRLYLTKPLGIGALLAAHWRSCCRARDFERLVATMLWQQHEFAQVAVQSGIDAGTDITGFGLAGHLLEMLTSSRVSATIYLNSIPVLDGAIDVVQAGIESSLIDDNLLADSRINALANVRALPKYRLLFDPQTCGGFLFGCSEAKSGRFLQLAEQAGLPMPQLIGYVSEADRAERPLNVELNRD